MASNTDKLRKSYSFLQKSLGGSIGDSDNSLTLNNYTNIPTDTAVDFIIDRIDANGNRTNNKREIVTGVCTGSAITGLVRGLHGTTAQAHDGGAIVEFVTSAAAWNDLIDAVLEEHNQDGTHDNTKVVMTSGAQTIAGVKTFSSIPVLPANTVDTTQLADGAVETAKINDDAVTAAKMAYGVIRNRQGNTTGDNSWATGGTNNTDTSAKAVFLQAGAAVGGSGSVTFPTAYSVTPLVFVSVMTAGTQNVWARANSVSTTGFNWQIFTNTTTGGTSETISWLAIGQ